MNDKDFEFCNEHCEHDVDGTIFHCNQCSLRPNSGPDHFICQSTLPLAEDLKRYQNLFNNLSKKFLELEQQNENYRLRFFESCMYISLKKIIDNQNDALQYYKSELIDKNNPHHGYQRRPDCGTAVKALRETKEKLEELGL